MVFWSVNSRSPNMFEPQKLSVHLHKYSVHMCLQGSTSEGTAQLRIARILRHFQRLVAAWHGSKGIQRLLEPFFSLKCLSGCQQVTSVSSESRFEAALKLFLRCSETYQAPKEAIPSTLTWQLQLHGPKVLPGLPRELPLAILTHTVDLTSCLVLNLGAKQVL